MALGFTYSSGEGGDFLDIVKFDSRAGRIFRIDRANGEKTTVDITKNFKCVADLENIECGYINFSTGGAPDFQLVPLGSPKPAKRTPQHKQGVRVVVKLHSDCGGDVREISSTASVFLRGFDALHDAYEAGKAANAGKLPVVIVDDFTPITSGTGDKKSTNYQPVFKIAGWAPRPVDLVASPRGGGDIRAAVSNAAAGDIASNGSVRATPPATGGTRVDPPTQRTPEPVGAADDGGFG